MTSCTLFLDFDGVTHPDPCLAERVFCQLPLIEDVLLEFASVEIVISSSWRDHHSIQELRELFSLEIKSRVIAVTPSITNPGPDWLPGFAPQFERQWECESWLKTNRPWNSPWIAIDDRPHWFAPNCSNLLVTFSNFGFCAEDQELLRRMLKERT